MARMDQNDDRVVAFVTALHNLKYSDMTDIAEEMVALLPTNKGPMVSAEAMAKTLSDLQESMTE